MAITDAIDAVSIKESYDLSKNLDIEPNDDIKTTFSAAKMLIDKLTIYREEKPREGYNY